MEWPEIIISCSSNCLKIDSRLNHGMGWIKFSCLLFLLMGSFNYYVTLLGEGFDQVWHFVTGLGSAEHYVLLEIMYLYNIYQNFYCHVCLFMYIYILVLLLTCRHTDIRYYRLPIIYFNKIYSSVNYSTDYGGGNSTTAEEASRFQYFPNPLLVGILQEAHPVNNSLQYCLNFH